MDYRSYRLLSISHLFNLYHQDFDGGLIGQTVTTGLTMPSLASKVTWTVVPADSFPKGIGEVADAVAQERIWIAVTGTLPFLLIAALI